MDKYYNQYFILSSSCALTKGAKRTLIQDFQRSNADFVPNDYFSLCNLLNRHKISDVANGIEEGSLPDYYQFVDFMIEKSMLFSLIIFKHSLRFHLNCMREKMKLMMLLLTLMKIASRWRSWIFFEGIEEVALYRFASESLQIF